MVSRNPQWLEHSNNGRARYQGSVGEDRERRLSEEGCFPKDTQQSDTQIVGAGNRAEPEIPDGR